MAKNLLLTFLFCTLLFTFNQLVARDKGVSTSNNPLKVEECDAPPPDSFHVTSAGAHFAALAWQPAWNGALHTLTVLKKEGTTNAWEPIDTFHNVPGSSYTVSNLQYGEKYRFWIATDCTNGEPSKKIAVTEPPVGLILDLVLLGRTPTNPMEISSCLTPIPYENFNWVGFSVGNIMDLNSAFNYFEFDVDEVGIPVIKRVDYGPAIVAAELGSNLFPTHQNKVVELGESSFQIFRYLGENNRIIIGILDVTYDDQKKTVRICKSMGDPWNPGYSFKLITAQSANGLRPSEREDRFDSNLGLDRKAKVQSPFNSMLNIFFPESHTSQGTVSVSLFNINGQTVIEKHFDEISNQISLSVESLSAGLYILQIASDGEVQAHKVVKSE